MDNDENVPEEKMREEDLEICMAILNDNPICYENEFKRYLLPLLKEGATAKDRDNWLRIAGNGRMPVHVAKDGDRSKILFTVPGIDIKPLINSVPMGMSEAVGEALRLGDVHPMKGKAFATKLYNSLIGDLSIDPNDAKAWKYIFGTYIDMGRKKTIEDKSEVSDLYDDEEFDDW